MWPDISKKLWSLIIQKLNLFTNVNLDQYELSATKLKLTNLEVDTSKITLENLDTLAVSIGSLGLEIGVSGLVLDAHDLYLEFRVDPGSRDMDLSAVFGTNEEELVVQGSRYSKFTDLALSQVSASFNSIKIKLVLNDFSYLIIEIEQVIFHSKEKLEFENLTVTLFEELEMQRSVYFDAHSQLDFQQELLSVNHFVVNLNKNSVEIDLIRLSLLSSIKLVVILLNDNLLPKSKPSNQSNDFSCFVHFIKVYDNLETSSDPLELGDIKLLNGSLEINSLHLQDCLSMSPFLFVDMSNFNAKVLLPISINLPLSKIVNLSKLVSKISDLLSDLEQNDTKPAEFSLDFSELRIQVGEFIMLVFPTMINHLVCNFSEIVLYGFDSQLALSGVEVTLSQLEIVLNEVSMNLTPAFLENVDALMSVFKTEEETNYSGVALPLMDLKINKLKLNYLQFLVNLNLHCITGDNQLSLKSNVTVEFDNSLFNFEFQALSRDQLRSIESAALFKKMEFRMPLEQPKKQEKEQQHKAFNGPKVSLSLKFDCSLHVSFPLKEIFFELERSQFQLESEMFLQVPKLVGFLYDGTDKIEVLKAKNIRYFSNNPQTFSVSKCVLSTCADSLRFLTDLVNESVVGIDVDDDLTIINNMERSVYIPESLPKRQGEPKIMDNYMNPQLKNMDLKEVMFMVKVKQFQFQIYDGYDFSSSRDQASQMANSVPSQPTEPPPPDDEIDSSDEDEDENAFNKLADSMFIKPQPLPSKKQLKKHKHNKEKVTSESFVRSDTPFVILTLKKIKFIQVSSNKFEFTIRDGSVTDLMPKSKVTDLVKPVNDVPVGGFLIKFVEDNKINRLWSLDLTPLKVSIDQDTAEFLNAFFTFGAEASDENNTKTNQNVIDQFDFGGLKLVIDYIPKKLSYKRIKRGTLTELLNVFTVKGSKLELKRATVFESANINHMLEQLLLLWTPDIKNTQIAGLVKGITPIRKTLKLSKNVRNYVEPIQTSDVYLGAGALFRRAIDEIVKYGQSWLDKKE